MKTIELHVEAKGDFGKTLNEQIKRIDSNEMLHFCLITSHPVNQLSKGAILSQLFQQLSKMFHKAYDEAFFLKLLEKNLTEEQLKELTRESFNLDWEWEIQEAHAEKESWNYTFAQNVGQAFEEDEPDYGDVPLKERNPDFKPWNTL